MTNRGVVQMNKNEWRDRQKGGGMTERREEVLLKERGSK